MKASTNRVNNLAIKYLITLLFLIFVLNTFAQQSCDTIFWSAARKLAWSDFKNLSADSNSTTTQSFVKIGYKVSQDDDYALVKVSAYFIPCRSFTNNQNSPMLQHEQLHFDIAEYHKRLFVKKVSEITAVSDIFPSAVKALFRDISEQRKSMEAEYDTETKKGTNEEAQKKWNAKVAALLFETEMYNEPVIKKPFKSP